MTKLTVNIFSIWQQLVVGYFLLWSEAQLSRPAGLQNKGRRLRAWFTLTVFWIRDILVPGSGSAPLTNGSGN
jgi:hypothetical protein